MNLDITINARKQNENFEAFIEALSIILGELKDGIIDSNGLIVEDNFEMSFDFYDNADKVCKP